MRKIIKTLDLTVHTWIWYILARVTSITHPIIVSVCLVSVGTEGTIIIIVEDSIIVNIIITRITHLVTINIVLQRIVNSWTVVTHIPDFITICISLFIVGHSGTVVKGIINTIIV